MKTGSIKRIAVLGPESSGKTELCKRLAEKFNTVFVPEFARSYLPALHRGYTPSDLLYIAIKQQLLERQYEARANRLLFCDTELINIRQWCLHKFGFSYDWIEHQIRKKPYSFYLLTAPDLPWQYDPLRENPGKGDYFFSVYKNDVEYFGFPYAVITGTGSERMRCAVDAVSRLLSDEDRNI